MFSFERHQEIVSAGDCSGSLSGTNPALRCFSVKHQFCLLHQLPLSKVRPSQFIKNSAQPINPQSGGGKSPFRDDTVAVSKLSVPDLKQREVILQAEFLA